MITFVGLIANVFGAVVLYSSSVLNGALVTFSVFELGLLGVVYGLIFFYKAKPEVIDAAVNSCTSLTNRCSKSPKSEYESPIEHNFVTEFHPIINNPENTNVYVVNEEVQEESRSEVAISSRKSTEKSVQEQEDLEKKEEESEKDRKESVKGTPFDSEAEEEELNEDNDDKIEETMQASSSFAEITPDSEPNEKSPKNETSTAANDN